MNNSSIHRRNLAASAAFGLFLVVAASPAPVRANLSGFGTTGTGYTLNQGQLTGGLSVSNNVATLTDGRLNEGNSLFNVTRQNVNAFNVSFTYQDVGSTGATATADGFTFTIQNDSNYGTGAVGFVGNALGYVAGSGVGLLTKSAISPSVAVGFNIYNTSGTYLGTNGTFGALTGTTNTSLYSGNKINVALSYNGTNLSGIITDTFTNRTDTFSYAVNIPNVVGNGGMAYVGFTGADGAVASTQQISNFTFSSVPEPATWVGGFGVCGLLGLTLRRRFAAAFLA